MNRIFRYSIPVDDQDHAVELSSTCDPLKVDATRTHGVVEFWALNVDRLPTVTRWYRVLGTGQPIPNGYRYVATSVAPGGLCWHLFERVHPTTAAVAG